MNAVSSVLATGCELAAVYGLVVLAVVLAFRICNFADLTLDGSFTLGAAITATTIMSGGSPLTAFAAALICGALAGTATVLLHTRLGVNRLLAGIITMTMLYSINLRIMGRPNIPLLQETTAFSWLANPNLATISYVTITLVIACLLWAFLKTDLGFFLRAAGENPRVIVRKGYTEEMFLLVGIPAANALTAFAGSVAAQNQGFADAGMGAGLVVASLTALLLGEGVILPTSVGRMLAAALAGAFCYQVAVGIGLRMGINPWDLKLATGLLLVLALFAKQRSASRRQSMAIGSDPL